MKLSVLIEKLRAEIEEHGDIDVVIQTDGSNDGLVRAYSDFFVITEEPVCNEPKCCLRWWQHFAIKFDPPPKTESTRVCGADGNV